MERLYELARQAAEKIKQTDDIINLISHYDADGIASAAIMIKALTRENKKFHVTIVKQIKPELIEYLQKLNPNLVIFTDLGSGYIEELSKLNCEVIVADHHEIRSNSNRILQINPKLFGLDLSGACMAYLIAKSLSEKNKDLSALAVVGIIGDMLEYSEGKILLKEIIKDAPEFVQVEKGLKFFGRMTRPIHRALELSYDPYIPGISGSESSAIQFLSDLGISVKNGDKWRTLSDLSEKELRSLADAVIRKRLTEKGEANIFTDVYTLKEFSDELKDAKEFATVLNAAGRMDKASLGIMLCLGDKKALDDARSLIISYKRLIAGYVNWIENNPEKIRITENAEYVLAGDAIMETMIGTVVSICAKSFLDKDKAIFGFANAEDGIKISARRGSREIDMNYILNIAATDVGGVGGGHKQAAGATIPPGTENKFIEECEKLLKS